jgi:hypothetical protein
VQRVRDEVTDLRLLAQAWRSGQPTPETLCIFLGPYRNLTTLTAAVLGLHPECVVLNHGFSRVARHRSLAPFGPPSDPGFDRFQRFAVAASRQGRRGGYGGSIAASHAHERTAMQEASARAEESKSARPRVVVWKDSMRITNHLRTVGVPPRKLTQRNPRLRFLLPIRNPMDCAVSNIATGHGRYHATARHKDAPSLIDPLVHEIGIFADLANHWPDSFLYFVEGDEPRKTFSALAEFLGIGAPDEWLDLVDLTWDVRSTYDHPAELRSAYLAAVDYHLADHPELHARLRQFAR